ncbi:hypothetical protein [Pseudomonas sp. EL_65y_Pfl2_R95]|uniref:hypothetical protein n=1 Tax=Pseudomonas sp. EL_65y_Pfl2_R95 TaxID=3088698 RepID=UPI0030D7571A
MSKTSADTANLDEAIPRNVIAKAKELAAEGTKEPFGIAAGAILSVYLIRAFDRIERLEGDIQLLTDLLAGVEDR